MKKFVFFSMVFFSIINIKAQNYVLSFTGSGASTTIDSVQVQNLTTCNHLTVSGSDQLNLVPNAGISSIISDKSVINIYPNPSHHLCHINFNNAKAGEVNICIYDVSGKEIMRHNNVLANGCHSYTLEGLKAGVYFAQIKTPENNFCRQFISLSDKKSDVKITYTGNTSVETKSVLKKALVQMGYNNGERLLFKAYSGNYSRVITLIPTSTQTVNFVFLACNDGDGNHYGVVTIGTQTWMAENLKATKYNDGSSIAFVTGNSAWAALSTPAYCWYDNNLATNGSVYGALYNWYALDASSNGGKNVCPVGWHTPIDPDMFSFINYLGGLSNAGGVLKENCSGLWTSPNTSASNEYGFTALPGGGRYYSTNGEFYGITVNGTWWIQPEFSATLGKKVSIDNNSGYLIQDGQNKQNGYSVRCIKN